MRYETAQEQAGLEIGAIGLTRLFLVGAGLAMRFIDDVRLKVDGDRTKFQAIHEIVGKAAESHINHPEEASRHLLYVTAGWDESQPAALNSRVIRGTTRYSPASSSIA